MKLECDEAKTEEVNQLTAKVDELNAQVAKLTEGIQAHDKARRSRSCKRRSMRQALCNLWLLLPMYRKARGFLRLGLRLYANPVDHPAFHIE